MTAVHKIEKAVEDAKDKEEFMPRKVDYVNAEKYLKERKLPITLIELYDYLVD